jgi:hypothetical protein
LNAQGPVKNEQDQRHLQNRHWDIACEPRDEINISLSKGMALPKCGYISAA